MGLCLRHRSLLEGLELELVCRGAPSRRAWGRRDGTL